MSEFSEYTPTPEGPAKLSGITEQFSRIAVEYGDGGAIEQVIQQSRVQLIESTRFLMELNNRLRITEITIERLQVDLDTVGESDLGESSNADWEAHHKDTVFQLFTKRRGALKARDQLNAKITACTRYCETLRATIDECECRQQQLFPGVVSAAMELKRALNAMGEVPQLPVPDFDTDIDHLPARPVAPPERDRTFVMLADQAMERINPGETIFGPLAQDDRANDLELRDAPTEVLSLRVPALSPSTLKALGVE